jgi:hypothetical protein
MPMAEHNHRLAVDGSQFCQSVLHQTGADALALPVSTDCHRSQRSRTDLVAINFDVEAAEQDVPDQPVRVEGSAFDQHQPVIPQPSNKCAFSVASEHGTIQIGNGRIVFRGGGDNIHTCIVSTALPTAPFAQFKNFENPDSAGIALKNVRF